MDFSVHLSGEGAGKNSSLVPSALNSAVMQKAEQRILIPAYLSNVFIILIFLYVLLDENYIVVSFWVSLFSLIPFRFILLGFRDNFLPSEFQKTISRCYGVGISGTINFNDSGINVESSSFRYELDWSRVHTLELSSGGYYIHSDFFAIFIKNSDVPVGDFISDFLHCCPHIKKQYEKTYGR